MEALHKDIEYTDSSKTNFSEYMMKIVYYEKVENLRSFVKTFTFTFGLS